MRHVFIISDLHLGGRPAEREERGQVFPATQICHAYRELVGFIDWVRDHGREGDEELELVVNGDIVDFLAEDDFPEPAVGAQIWTASQEQVLAKLRHILARTREGRDRGVLEALAGFIRAGHRLTLILGNHDVELALPAVRAFLAEALDPTGGRLRTVFDGEAYTVGRLLIEHGNRYDRWNMVDHSG